MNTTIKDHIYSALIKYGVVENLCFEDDLIKGWENCVATEVVKTNITSDLSLRHRLINQGRILEENTDKHYYYWLVELKGLFPSEALVVTVLDCPNLYLGAYAKDGIISRSLAAQAISQIKDALNLNSIN